MPGGPTIVAAVDIHTSNNLAARVLDFPAGDVPEAAVLEDLGVASGPVERDVLEGVPNKEALQDTCITCLCVASHTCRLHAGGSCVGELPLRSSKQNM